MRGRACATLFMKLARGSVEMCLQEVCTLLAIADEFGMIGRAIRAFEVLNNCNIDISPDINSGDLLSPRVLCFRSGALTEQAVLEDIARPEGHSLEFKSSLLFDRKKFHAVGAPTGVEMAPFNSEEVLHASLKTIAASLNCDGGTLYIGVDDDGGVAGLAVDFSLFKSDKVPEDEWELRLKSHIVGKFKDGNTINGYVRVQFATVDNKCVAKVSVSRRSAMTFVRDKTGTFTCYRRQGNQSVKVEITEIEEFIDKRRQEASAL